jgi:hypothetical protein
MSPAGDGIPNLLKYAFGCDPHQNGSLALPQFSFVQVVNSQTGQPEKKSRQLRIQFHQSTIPLISTLFRSFLPI